MEKNELMLGDWVLWHDKGWASDGKQCEETRRCQITSIRECGFSVEWTDEDGFCDVENNVFDEDVKPIPLTSEILEKNGWKDISFDSEADYYNDDVEMVSFYEGKDGNAWWWHVGLELAAPINYVHELQHILKLFKIDKEIEL